MLQSCKLVIAWELPFIITIVPFDVTLYDNNLLLICGYEMLEL